jgi:hypothetical protein
VETIAATLPVRTSRAQLWAALVRKAEDPVPFIPAITACQILERYPDGGLLREIVIGYEHRQRERARFEPEDRVVFAQLTDPNLTTIVNEIGADADGPTLTLAVELSEAGAARGPEFIEQTRAYFTGTLRAIVDTMHANAGVAGG